MRFEHLTQICTHEQTRQFWKDCELHAPSECFKTVCDDCDTVTYRDCVEGRLENDNQN